GRVEFLINIETQMEIWGLPNLDSETGRFYGAARRVVEAPADYNRIMFGGNASYKEEQFNFLRSLQHDRFLELQRVTGAYQGEVEINRNQLLGAFHLWCAEHNASDFFLSYLRALEQPPSDSGGGLHDIRRHVSRWQSYPPDPLTA